MQGFSMFLQKLYKKWPVILFDVVSIPLAWYLAYWLRFNLIPIPYSIFKAPSLTALGLLLLIQPTCYYYYKVYRGLWRFSSLNDAIRIIKAIFTATAIALPIFYLSSILMQIPRSILPLYLMILTTFLCSARLVTRAYRDRRTPMPQSPPQRVLIIGAGRAGESLVRDLNRLDCYVPVGFIDDDRLKHGLEIHAVEVLGSSSMLERVIAEKQVDIIFIAIPSASSAVMRRMVDECKRSQVAFRTLPSLSALASGFVQVNSLREVSLDDLLGRDQVKLDWDKIATCVENKNIVVTGGGGSIGSELCRQVLRFKPAKLLIIDNSEFNLYSIEQELRNSYTEQNLEVALISVTDAVGIERYFQKFEPDIVFHAAAFKHVPLLEEQIRMAVLNNVIGTQTVAEASVKVKAEKFILISTDKAVNPANVMGTTKRVAELYCQNLNTRVETQFITVRFGNVLGSAGSVVPLFRKQLQAGGPLTVTHPDIERYFMSIPEASQLILQAMANGQGSEIFVLDMGEPIKISYLAEQMIYLAGKVPGKDIEIKYTGLRPGEKLFEELFHEAEQLIKTEHEKLFKARFRELNWHELRQTMRLLSQACQEFNQDELYILIRSLVPEFKPQAEDLCYS